MKVTIENITDHVTHIYDSETLEEKRFSYGCRIAGQTYSSKHTMMEGVSRTEQHYKRQGLHYTRTNH